jgi:hypothetical protein
MVAALLLTEACQSGSKLIFNNLENPGAESLYGSGQKLSAFDTVRLSAPKYASSFSAPYTGGIIVAS